MLSIVFQIDLNPTNWCYSELYYIAL